jgi:hypothetical protein
MEGTPKTSSFLAPSNPPRLAAERESLVNLIHWLFPSEVLEAMFVSRKCDHFFAEVGRLDFPSLYAEASLHVAAWGGWEAIFDTEYRGKWVETYKLCITCEVEKSELDFAESYETGQRRPYCRECGYTPKGERDD